MSKALTKTDFHFPGQKSVYHGKVRDVYNINDEKVGNGCYRPYLGVRRRIAGRYPL